MSVLCSWNCSTLVSLHFCFLLQGRNLLHREAKSLAQSHTVPKYQNWDPNAGILTSEPGAINYLSMTTLRITVP